MLQSLNFVIIVFANQDLPPLKAEGDYFRILTTEKQDDTSWKIDKDLNLLNEKNEKIGTLNTSPSEADSSFYWRKRQPYLKLKDSDSGITFNFKFDVVENKKLEDLNEYIEKAKKMQENNQDQTITNCYIFFKNGKTEPTISYGNGTNCLDRYLKDQPI